MLLLTRETPPEVLAANARTLAPSVYTSKRSQFAASSSTRMPWSWYRRSSVASNTVSAVKSASRVVCISRAVLFVPHASCGVPAGTEMRSRASAVPAPSMRTVLSPTGSMKLHSAVSMFGALKSSELNSGGGASARSAKVAAISASASSVMAAGFEAPVRSPDQPSNSHPASAVAVRVTPSPQAYGPAALTATPPCPTVRTLSSGCPPAGPASSSTTGAARSKR